MPVQRGMETLSKEITDMTQADKNEITYICRKEDIVRWVLLIVGKRVTRHVLGSIPVCLVGAMTKLGMKSRKNLLGSRRTRWTSKTIVILGFLEDCVLRRNGN